MTQTVTAEDGTVHNFPDEATPEMIAGALGVQPPQQNLAQRIGAAYQRRVGEAQTMADQFVAGKVGAEAGPGMMLKIAGIGPEAMTETVKSTISGVNDLAYGLPGKALSGVAQIAGQLPSFGGGTIGENIPQELNTIQQGYGRFKETHPRLAIGLGIANDASNLALGGLGAKQAAEGIGTGLSKIPLPSGPKPQATADQLKKLASQAYAQADEIGGAFQPQVANDFVLEIQKIKPKPIAGKVLTSENAKFAKDIQEFEGLADTPLSLDDIKRLDQDLTMKINNYIDNATGNPNAHGRNLMELQDRLREIVDNVPGQPGLEALNQGKTLWAAQRRLQDLENIAERASMTQNPGTALQNGYRALYMNKSRIRGYSPEERALLKKAATPGISDDLLGIIGSRLNTIAAAAAGGGFTGSGAAYITGVASRGAKEKLIAGRGVKLQNTMVNRAVKESNIKPESLTDMMKRNKARSSSQGAKQ